MPPTDHAFADRCRSAATSGRRPGHRWSGLIGIAIAVSGTLAGCVTAGSGNGAATTDDSKVAAAENQRVPNPITAPTAYPSTYQPLARVATLIRGATILDGTGQRLEHTDLLLNDGKVAAIGAALAAPEGATIIEAAGRWVTPGIIDPHSHIGNFPTPYTGEDSAHTDVNEDTDPNTAQVWAQHSINVQDPGFSRALAGGVTTLHVMPGSTNLFGGRSIVLRNVPATTVQGMIFPDAPFGLKMACGENVIFSGSGRFPVSRMGAIAGQRTAWQQARRYLESWQKYERGDSEEPPDQDLQLDTLAAVLAGDIRVHIHCYRADDMAQMLDLAREFGYRITAFHHATDGYKIPELLLRNEVCVAVWPDWWGYKREAYDAIRENAAYLHAAGVCVAMHSDSNISGQRLNIEAAKSIAAGRRAGVAVAPEQAIEWITRNPARMLGLADQTGTLESGKRADVVIWSADPFSIYAHADQVFVDGGLAYDRSNPARQPWSDMELGQPISGRP